MGLFDLFGKGNKKDSEISTEETVLTIARIVSDNDANIMDNIKACMEDTEAYFENHGDSFEERGFDEFEDEEIEEIRWIALVDALESNQYVCERDWKDELEDFLYFVGELKGVKSKELTLNSEWFDEDDDISVWCTILDKRWEAKGVCMAAIDINSDSYVLFPCEIDELDRLGKLAESIDSRIDYAKNM